MARLNFGYLKRGSFWVDLKGRFLGEPNLFKRLQADALFEALDIKVGVRALDVGCGSGYLTVELARAGAEALGIDINPFVNTIPVPSELTGKLRFEQASGAELPLKDGIFDVVLASEVLPMLPEPEPFVREIRRVIKPGGRLVVANGVGPTPIFRAYEAKDPRLDLLRGEFPERFPETYDEYAKAFQRAAGTSRDDFLSLDSIVSLLSSHGFEVNRVIHAPSRRAADWLAWHQFEHFLSTGKIVPELPFLRTFTRLSCLAKGDTEGYEGGPIVVAYAD